MKNETYRKLCIGLIILMGLDLILTIIGVEYMGMVELNPLYVVMGVHGFIMLKILLFGISIVLFYLFKDNTHIFYINKTNLIKICFISMCIFLNTIYGLVILNNIYVIGCVLI